SHLQQREPYQGDYGAGDDGRDDDTRAANAAAGGDYDKGTGKTESEYGTERLLCSGSARHDNTGGRDDRRNEGKARSLNAQQTGADGTPAAGLQDRRGTRDKQRHAE